MRKGQQGLVALIIVVVLLLAGVAFYASTLSIAPIGEEGFVPYDALLAGGSFDHAKFVESGGSCAGLIGGTDRARNCPGVIAVPYSGISVRNGNLVQDVIGYVADDQQRSLRTADLRLVDFRMEFTLYPGGQDGGTVCWYGYCYTDTRGSNARTPSPVAALDLRWDDYATGHYQLFINNQLAQEGVVPEGTPFYLSKTPASNDPGFFRLGEEMTWINPRVKALFGCDLQAGEVKVHTCTAGPAVVSLDDLKGFKRFCPNLPATFTDAGVATASKRVYYSLAQGKPVTIQQNQVWEFQYLADSKAMNTPPDKTGIVELCKGPLLIEDLKDLPSSDPVIVDRTLSWSSSGRFDGTNGYRTKKVDLQSGSSVFMHTTSIQIDDAQCPYTDAPQSYPGLPSSCFTLQSYGKTFHDGDTVAVTDGLNVTLDSLAVSYRLDPTIGREYEWSARWKLSFSPDAAVLLTPTLAAARQGTDFSPNYQLTSHLPSTGSYLTTIQVQSVLTGSSQTLIANTTVKAKDTVMAPVSLPTDTLGEQRITATPVLQTEAGGIAFATTAANYTVTAAGNASLPGTPSESNPATGADATQWWEQFWDWLKSLFTF